MSIQVSPASTAKNGSKTNTAQLIADQLESTIGSVRYETWFGHEQCIRVQPNLVLVSASSPFTLQRIQSSFGREIRSVVDRVCGPQFLLDFVLAESQQVAPQPAPAATPATRTESLGRVGKRQPRGLSTFCFGNENRLAETSCQQIIERPGQYSPLFICGPTGSGKTHLLEAITSDVRRRKARQRCVFLSAEQFTNHFLQALRGSGLPVFRKKYRDLDLLAIDDIQFLAGKKATVAEFQFTIDKLNRNGKQVVLSSDRTPAELPGLAPELIARLTSGLICPLNYPDFDGRLVIAQRFCREREFSIPLELLRLVCERLPYDVRRISGAINRLHAARVATGRRIREQDADRILSDLFAVSAAPSASLTQIEKAVCEFCQIQAHDLKSSSRKKRICTARMLAMYLSRRFTSSAYSEIGDYFGGRSHSTVIAAQKKVNDWLESDHQIVLPHAAFRAKDLVQRIETQLRIG